jgi:hypothetical protein
LVSSAAIRILALEDKTRTQGKLRNKATKSYLLFGHADSQPTMPRTVSVVDASPAGIKARALAAESETEEILQARKLASDHGKKPVQPTALDFPRREPVTAKV